MSTTTRIADDFAAIRLELERIEREKKTEREMPKAQPDYSTMYDGVYQADDFDPA